MNETVYLIVQVWTPSGSDYELQEIVDGVYYKTRQDAQDALYVIAGELDIELDPGVFSFDNTNPVKGIEAEFYYIEELWLNG